MHHYVSVLSIDNDTAEFTFSGIYNMKQHLGVRLLIRSSADLSSSVCVAASKYFEAYSFNAIIKSCCYS